MKAHHIRNSNTPRGKINPSIDPVLINSLPKRPISSTDFKSIGHQWTSEPSLQLHGFCSCWYSVTKNSAFSNSADVPPEKSTCFQVNTMSIIKRSKWLNVTNNQNYRSIERWGDSIGDRVSLSRWIRCHRRRDFRSGHFLTIKKTWRSLWSHLFSRFFRA